MRVLPISTSFLLFSVLMPVMLAACGKNNAPPVASVAGVAATCSAGQVRSPTYGCLQPSGTSGFGRYNGTQVSVACWSGTVMTQSGCQPQGTCSAGQGQYNQAGYGNSNCATGQGQQVYYGQGTQGNPGVQCPYGGRPGFYNGQPWCFPY